MDIEQILHALSNEEKVKLLVGYDFWNTHEIKRLNIPSITLTDGPHGLRKSLTQDAFQGLSESVKAVCFPTASSMANAFNLDLIESVGEAIAMHAKSEDVHVLLAPGANIKRSPLCGRNFEYYSEDPYLSGMCAASFIKGVEKTGIQSSLKHFVANNQETRRMSIDAIIDERALRELYLKSFEIAIKEGKPSTVMTAYNKINGQYASEHTHLLHEVLRKQWGYQGVILSDWGAVNDRVASLKAGLDLEMPGPSIDNQKALLHAIKHKTLSMRIVNDSVRRILKMIKKTQTLKKEPIDLEAMHHLAQKMAEESIVLLRNEKERLPLSEGTNIALIGELAEKPRYQGAGSSQINATKVISLKNSCLEAGVNFTYAKGYSANDDFLDEGLITQAVSVAKDKDVIILSIGLTDSAETEGLDRTHLKIPHNQFKLIKALKTLDVPIVLVLFGGSVFQIPYQRDFDTILSAYLPGQAGGKALYNVLFGKTNPSGKLSETWPHKLSDVPTVQYFSNQPYYQHYRESIYVGYRYYDKALKEPLFPFGHGLSYTQFELSEGELSLNTLTSDEELTITLNVKNVGEYEGAEVVQCYIKNNDSTLYKAEKELKAFKKVHLKPGEEKTVVFDLSINDFSYYHAQRGKFITESGDYAVWIGTSSKNIIIKHDIKVVASKKYSPHNYQRHAPSYYTLKSEPFTVSTSQFQAVYGSGVPTVNPKKITFNTPLEDLKHTIIGTKLNDMVNKQKHDSDLMTQSIIKTIPLRVLSQMSQGKLSKKKALILVDFMNHEFFKGIKRIFKQSK